MTGTIKHRKVWVTYAPTHQRTYFSLTIEKKQKFLTSNLLKEGVDDSEKPLKAIRRQINIQPTFKGCQNYPNLIPKTKSWQRVNKVYIFEFNPHVERKCIKK